MFRFLILQQKSFYQRYLRLFVYFILICSIIIFGKYILEPNYNIFMLFYDKVNFKDLDIFLLTARLTFICFLMYIAFLNLKFILEYSFSLLVSRAKKTKIFFMTMVVILLNVLIINFGCFLNLGLFALIFNLKASINFALLFNSLFYCFAICIVLCLLEISRNNFLVLFEFIFGYFYLIAGGFEKIIIISILMVIYLGGCKILKKKIDNGILWRRWLLLFLLSVLFILCQIYVKFDIFWHFFEKVCPKKKKIGHEPVINIIRGGYLSPFRKDVGKWQKIY